MKIRVYHRGYDCDTGCCGHVVEVDGNEVGGFNFMHPYGEDHKAFAEKMISDQLGPEHVKDLDWESCEISDE